MGRRRGEHLGGACLLFVLILFSAGCSSSSSSITSSGPAPAAPAGRTSTSSVPAPTSATSASSIPPTPTRAATQTLAPEKPAIPAADSLAGLRSETVKWKATGRIHVVPGKVRAPGKARRTYTVRVEVEQGLNIDPTAFASFVMATLNDKRSWTEHGKRRFARTDAANADIRVLLASPALSARICLPLRTYGKLSCRHGANTAVLTDYRWVKAIAEYGKNRTGYRHYVVNHEVGHVLGHHHEYCAGEGRLAPLMMQQTKGLKGCRPNPWPHP